MTPTSSPRPGSSVNEAHRTPRRHAPPVSTPPRCTTRRSTATTTRSDCRRSRQQRRPLHRPVRLRRRRRHSARRCRRRCYKSWIAGHGPQHGRSSTRSRSRRTSTSRTSTRTSTRRSSNDGGYFFLDWTSYGASVERAADRAQAGAGWRRVDRAPTSSTPSNSRERPVRLRARARATPPATSRDVHRLGRRAQRVGSVGRHRADADQQGDRQQNSVTDLGTVDDSDHRHVIATAAYRHDARPPSGGRCRFRTANARRPGSDRAC